MRVLLVIPLLAACAAQGVPPPEARREAQRINSLDTASLWSVQSTTSDRTELAQVEAELGSRGEVRSGAAYLGRKTASRVGRSRYRRTSKADPLDGVNCEDFLTNAAAQAEFLGSGGPIADRHKLDPDGDGLACGWGTELRRSVAAARGQG